MHAGRGWGSIFRKTPDIGLASYSIIPVRKRGRQLECIRRVVLCTIFGSMATGEGCEETCGELGTLIYEKTEASDVQNSLTRHQLSEASDVQKSLTRHQLSEVLLFR